MTQSRPAAGADIVIRVDAGPHLGLGHVTRCLALARQARRRGAHVRFITRASPGNAARLVEAHRFAVDLLPDGAEDRDADDTLALLAGTRPDWLVVDHYSLGTGYLSVLRPAGDRILAIDDIGRAHDCDAVLDSSRFGTDASAAYAGLVPAHALQWMGPRYALLAPEYAPLRRLLPERHDRRRVLVAFGGADAADETRTALDALAAPAVAGLAVDVIIGPHHPDPDGITAAAARRPLTEVHRAPPSLAGLMARADFAFGAAGGTTWERLCLRLPAAVVTAAENQVHAAQHLHAAGYVHWLGDTGSVSRAAWLDALSAQRPSLASLPALVDGRGAARCARMMLDLARAGR
ncbi:MAG TPA: UDP-2,4-diacetamido-2,4,6-trideoxy-beta-L-altropyranose hydrolase [Longimicrobiales bacterium]|nr:UDP-2,4-diacetamido-2,4,6-trideoxy-beta-L-altropyranose hydrolase [Longimicrobiales bacterium]